MTNRRLISINEDFITEEEHLCFLELAKTLTEKDLWGKDVQPDSLWYDRYFFLNELPYTENGFGSTFDRKIFSKALEIRKRIQNAIVDFMKIDAPIYADCLQLNRWRPGDKQDPHADGEMAGEEKHPYPRREYGSILYLNNEYEGGNLYFPQYDLELEPKPRMLGFFPGTLDYLHGVREITNGTRYTLSAFWTTDIRHSDGM